MSESGRATVLLTGGTGFVGGYVARHLLQRGHRVRALVRDAEKAGGLREAGAELQVGDIVTGEGLDAAAKECDAAIHLVGIIREHPPSVTYEKVHTRGTGRVVEAAERAGVRKIVHMSALGARSDGTAYQRTKFEAEEVVRRASLAHVIFRPSTIVGVGGEFTELLVKLVRRLPVVPVIGDGRYRMQPVAVEDVAAAFVHAVERFDLDGQAFDVGGPHKLTYNRMLEIICEELDLRRRRVHVPASLVRPFIELASNWRLPSPVTPDQLTMLFEESIVPGDGSVLREIFGLELTSLRQVLQTYPD